MKKIAPPVFALFLFACGEPTHEETAEEVVAVAGSTMSALTTAAEVGADAQASQNEQQNDPAAPTGADAGCAQVSLAGGRLTVDYGTGCSVNGKNLAGAYSIYLMWMQGFGVGIDFASFSVDGRTQNGTMQVGLGRGRVETHIDLDIEQNQELEEVELDGTLLASQTDLNLDGSGRYANSVNEASFVAAGIHATVGACYPDAGSITINLLGYPEAVVTFDANTPSTGMVTVTVAGVFTTQQPLPAYGNCP